MGLDTVEFVLAVEEAFQIAIPDEEVQKMLTPRNVVDYVFARLSGTADRLCLEQRAFYRLRRATMRVFETPRSAVTASTPWQKILPGRSRRHNWRLLHQTAGTPQWPRLGLWGKIPHDVETVGGTARYLAVEATAALKGITAGWTRQQVEETVARLMKECLGITDFGWDQHFARDLRVD